MANFLGKLQRSLERCFQPGALAAQIQESAAIGDHLLAGLMLFLGSAGRFQRLCLLLPFLIQTVSLLRKDCRPDSDFVASASAS